MFAPGSTIGVLGSGQLGRMFTFEAHRLGYHVHVYSPDMDSPAGQAADVETVAAYDDDDALRRFAQQVDVVTLEFENVPATVIDIVDREAPVRPGRNVVAVAQNRRDEKSTLQCCGLPVARFAAVNDVRDIVDFFSSSGVFKGVLKSIESGYDGKGQTLVDGTDDAEDALGRIGHAASIIEELIDFECELSVIGARTEDGEIECFGPVLNQHQHHILDVSTAPATLVSQRIWAEALEMTQAVLSRLDVVGVLCVEFFLTTDGRLLINEIAPRPHNSGHLTIEAAVTNQFEQQVRAVCGLPLGSMRQIRPAAMANLLGEHLPESAAGWCGLLSFPDVKLHLYGKQQPRLGRKMGHLTVTDDDVAGAEAIVRSARSALVACPGTHT